jgi:hypothetical protein
VQEQTISTDSNSGSAALTATQLNELKSFIKQKARTCLHEASGILKYRFVIPTFGKTVDADLEAAASERCTIGYYLQMYDWDSCFFSQAQSFLGISGLARDIVSNFLGLKKYDGFIPRTVSPKSTWDSNDLCKPFLCQALLDELKKESFKRPLPAGFLQDLDCWLQYFRRSRMHQSGLFHWRNMLESGVDDNLGLIAPVVAEQDDNKNPLEYPDGQILAVDICSYLVSEFEAFRQIAEHYGENEIVSKYAKYAQDLRQAIEEKLWNERLAMYCNLNPRSGGHIAVRTWTNLTPVLLGIAKADRIKKCIEKNILNPEEFLRPYGMASVAASEPLYNQSRRGLYGRATVSNWQGPVWVLPNALAVRCLVTQGYLQEAKNLAGRVLRAMYKGFKSTGTLYENYHAETGAPLWAPDFMSWNVLALELIDLVL